MDHPLHQTKATSQYWFNQVLCGDFGLAAVDPRKNTPGSSIPSLKREDRN